MAKFDDYHRTVIGYHGTGLSAALRVVNRIDGFTPSERDHDWLGKGVYFWEYAPKQALAWARLRQRQYAKKAIKTADDERRTTEPLAVVACMIRLGFCLDLTEPENIRTMQDIFNDYKANLELAGESLPTNTRQYRRLDRAVFEYAYTFLQNTDPISKVDTARGVYVPTKKANRLWEGSWISRDTHIQLCVRSPASILGTWLHHPAELEVKDVCQALQAGPVGVQPTDPSGQEGPENDAAAGAD